MNPGDQYQVTAVTTRATDEHSSTHAPGSIEQLLPMTECIAVMEERSVALARGEMSSRCAFA